MLKQEEYDEDLTLKDKKRTLEEVHSENDGSGKAKRKYTRTSPEEKKRLEEFYQTNVKTDGYHHKDPKVTDLAQELGWDLAKVKSWFNNRASKERKKSASPIKVKQGDTKQNTAENQSTDGMSALDYASMPLDKLVNLQGTSLLDLERIPKATVITPSAITNATLVSAPDFQVESSGITKVKDLENAIGEVRQQKDAMLRSLLSKAKEVEELLANKAMLEEKVKTLDGDLATLTRLYSSLLVKTNKSTENENHTDLDAENKYLRKRNEELQQRVDELESRNRTLMEALMQEEKIEQMDGVSVSLKAEASVVDPM